jgi:Tfp pilus assembly protein PilX
MPVNKSMCSNIINHLDIQSHRFDPAPIKRQMVSLKKAAFHHQRGVSLFIVLIILLLSLIVVLGGLQVANLNESIVGNESDAQRAYGAAEALLDAAQRDIRRNGRDCNAPALGQTGTNSSLRAGTPAAAIACTLRYPRDTVDYMQMLTRNDIIGGIGKCSMNATYGGVCIANGPTDGKFRIDKVNNGQTTGAEQFNNGISYNNNFINIDEIIVVTDPIVELLGACGLTIIDLVNSKFSIGWTIGNTNAAISGIHRAFAYAADNIVTRQHLHIIDCIARITQGTGDGCGRGTCPEAGIGAGLAQGWRIAVAPVAAYVALRGIQQCLRRAIGALGVAFVADDRFIEIGDLQPAQYNDERQQQNNQYYE